MGWEEIKGVRHENEYEKREGETYRRPKSMRGKTFVTKQSN